MVALLRKVNSDASHRYENLFDDINVGENDDRRTCTVETAHFPVLLTTQVFRLTHQSGTSCTINVSLLTWVRLMVF